LKSCEFTYMTPIRKRCAAASECGNFIKNWEYYYFYVNYRMFLLLT
jgi:hypothetical protein